MSSYESGRGSRCACAVEQPHSSEEVWESATRQEQLSQTDQCYAIEDAVVRKNNSANRINTIMQTCFFAISGVLPSDEAIAKIKESIRKTYGKRGEPVVRQNFAAVDAALAHLHEVSVPAQVTSTLDLPRIVPEGAPEFVQNVTAEIIAGRGDQLPVSAFPVDGTYPVGTSQWEKRNIAQEVPVWEPDSVSMWQMRSCLSARHDSRKGL